jgi:hypothetical protein
LTPDDKVSLVKPIPLDNWQIGEAGPPITPEEYKAYCEREGILDEDRPLIPTSEEIAKLPRSSRIAFAMRCAARVAPIAGSGAPTEIDPMAAVSFLIAGSTVQTPVRRLLLRIRYDFDKLSYLARKNNWNDDTPVSQEVFGPMWPNGLIHEWSTGVTKTPADPV